MANQPFEITCKVEGFKEAISWLSDIEKKQIPFAIVMCLNQTAKDIKKAEQMEMFNVFKNPTPYTLNSLQITPARKNKTTAQIWFKKESYLIPQVEGGTREQKSSEHWLSPYMGGKYRFYTPGMGARLNKYGNVSPGMITQILSVLKVGIDPYSYTSKRSRKRNRRLPEYFAAGPYVSSKTPYPRTAHLQPGAYQRFGNGRIKPVLIFVPTVTYRKRFRFYEVATKVMQEVIQFNFRNALDHALRTAK